MPVLDFACTGVRPERYAVGPTLLFGLTVAERSGARVHALVLRVQIRIEPARRPYDGEEARRLLDLFGEPSRWGSTLKPMQLATVACSVPGFTGSTDVDLPVPVTYDTDVAAAKYFHALRGGEVPLLLLFTGTVFYLGDGGLQVEQVPWDLEARVGMPASLWRETMDLHFPGAGWLRLRAETVDALARYRSREALPTWDETFERLLKQAGEEP